MSSGRELRVLSLGPRRLHQKVLCRNLRVSNRLSLLPFALCDIDPDHDCIIDYESSHEAQDALPRKRHYEGPGNSFPPPPEALDEIGIIELLEQDSRPTFIIDINAPQQEVNGRMTFIPVYCNKSLRFFDSIRNVVCAETFYPSIAEPTPLQASLAAAEQEFKEWATNMPHFDSSRDGYLPRHQFLGMYWSSSTLRKKWRVVSASQVPSQRKKSHGTPRLARSRSNSKSSVSSVTIRPTLSATGDLPEESLVDEESDLSKQLADSESKFKVLTELNPVGMYYLSPDGNILYCNDTCEISPPNKKAVAQFL